MTTPSLLQSIITASTLLAGFGILYTFALVIWRLYFSPISHFPGPRLAALTYWYEFYYDLIQRGRFLYKIQELHDQYGPIIRINPHELHVSDPDFYHTIYAGGSSKRNRDPYHTDVISQYLFGTSEHRLEAEDFDPSYHNKILGAAGSTVVVKHFPIIPSIIDNLPEFVTDHVGALADQKKMKKIIAGLIENVRNKGTKSTTTETTIFHTLLESDLPPSEKTTTRLTEEGITLVGAGSHTVAWALTVGCFHVLSNPYILSTLKSELATINRDDGEALNSVLSQLEKLPFLTGIIKESLRLSYGTSLRLPRIDPEKSMQFHEWSIPPGTAVSMTGALMHHDESIFPDSKEFKPERWVENKGLDRYLTSFSAGSRACLGITLAWAELYLGFAGVFGKIGGVGEKGERGVMRLVGTDRSDVEIVGDAFFPLVREGSEGVKVLITS
ncbi:hypothetical protein ACEPPN_016483 [Leptodophora sp. 'Broadleaf-Isolate-01']